MVLRIRTNYSFGNFDYVFFPFFLVGDIDVLLILFWCFGGERGWVGFIICLREKIGS